MTDGRLVKRIAKETGVVLGGSYSDSLAKGWTGLICRYGPQQREAPDGGDGRFVIDRPAVGFVNKGTSR